MSEQNIHIEEEEQESEGDEREGSEREDEHTGGAETVRMRHNYTFIDFPSPIPFHLF